MEPSVHIQMFEKVNVVLSDISISVFSHFNHDNSVFFMFHPNRICGFLTVLLLCLPSKIYENPTQDNDYHQGTQKKSEQDVIWRNEKIPLKSMHLLTTHK